MLGVFVFLGVCGGIVNLEKPELELGCLEHHVRVPGRIPGGPVLAEAVPRRWRDHAVVNPAVVSCQVAADAE